MSPVKGSALVRDPIPAAPDPARSVITLVPKPPKKKRAPKAPTGYYRRKGSDVWYFRRTINGIEINQSTGFTDLEDARRRGTELEQAQREGDLGWVSAKAPTVAEYYATYRKKSYRLDPFVQAHGKLRLTQITPDICEAWIADRLQAKTRFGRPYAPGTIHLEGMMLRGLFQRAVGPKKPLRENPWKINREEKVKLPKKSVRSRKLRTGDEQTRFFDACDKVDTTGMVTRSCKIMMGSGLRLDEWATLRPCDVWDEPLAIHIREEIAKYGKERTIPIHADTFALVEVQRAARGLSRHSTEALFNTIVPKYLGQLIHKACRLAGITRKLTPHDFRRTYASRMAKLVPPRVLQILMGHEQINTTMVHYTVVDEDEIPGLVGTVACPIE